MPATGGRGSLPEKNQAISRSGDGLVQLNCVSSNLPGTSRAARLARARPVASPRRRCSTTRPERQQAVRPLGRSGCTCYQASTDRLSTRCSAWGLVSSHRNEERRGRLILGAASRLDAFSASPFSTWRSSRGMGIPTGTLAVEPSRSSRTGDDCPQSSYAHDG